ncbi:hypothetical protein [Pseudolysinimonas sp.]|uniref:hypothetical protein n=1 Tax=Pseudolysinimonas sp. TaxID=2680009 RepID=UPI003F81E60D
MTDLQELAVFDLETTGVNEVGDLIVTAYVGHLGADGEVIRSQEWLVDPTAWAVAHGDAGADMTRTNLAAAAEVHGWTLDRLAADPRTRRDLDDVVREIAGLIWALCGDLQGPRLPLAGHNLAFDLTMLQAHLRRAGSGMFPFGGSTGVCVLDSAVLDKKFNRFVRGSGQRKLTPTAARYGIELTEEQAHDSSFDAIASGRIVQAVLEKHVSHRDFAALHDAQVIWRREQQTDLEAWFHRPKPKGGGEPNLILPKEWPVHV